MLTSFWGNLCGDVLLFPLETVLHRLFVQGTRAIIDNTDTGTDVIPITTQYEGFFDCVTCILRDEGLCGFFKGFGALIMQYMAHYFIIVMTRRLIEWMANDGASAPVVASEYSRSLHNKLDDDFDAFADRSHLQSSRHPASGDRGMPNADHTFYTSTPRDTPLNTPRGAPPPQYSQNFRSSTEGSGFK